MHALWTEDAVYTNPLGTLQGADAIATFFANTPLWGDQIMLSPVYKTEYDIHGNSADFVFECVVVSVPGGDGLTMALADATGNQTETAEIVQHIEATGTIVRQGDRWLFDEFTATLVPTAP